VSCVIGKKCLKIRMRMSLRRKKNEPLWMTDEIKFEIKE
jgi:hypothetical protein